MPNREINLLDPRSAHDLQTRIERASKSVPAEVAALQQTILQAMRDGATFSTAHKEGGAVIRFDGQRYVYAEYGDNQTRREFAADAELLAFLRQFFAYLSSHASGPAGMSEAEAWRLILQRLELRREGTLKRGVSAAVVVVLALAAGLAYLKFGAKAGALRAGSARPALERVQALPAAPPQEDWRRLQDGQLRAVEAAKAAARPASR
jgi:hypothetical protein